MVEIFFLYIKSVYFFKVCDPKCKLGDRSECTCNGRVGHCVRWSVHRAKDEWPHLDKDL